MTHLPIASIVQDKQWKADVHEATHSIVNRMVNATGGVTTAHLKVLLTNMQKRIEEVWTKDHFLPSSERGNFFVCVPMGVFSANKIDTLNAIKTNNVDDVFAHILCAYQKYIDERRAYWILHTAIDQKYSKLDLQNIQPTDLSGLSDLNWKHLMHRALCKYHIGGVEFIAEVAPQLNYQPVLVDALNLKAQICLEYILPRLRLHIDKDNGAHVLHLCGFEKEINAFKDVCAKIDIQHYNDVRTHLCNTASAQIVQIFDDTTAPLQNKRLQTQVENHGKTGSPRKI